MIVLFSLREDGTLRDRLISVNSDWFVDANSSCGADFVRATLSQEEKVRSSRPD
jgi:hypothetical protein